jgi:hypothetical protein
MTFTAPKPHMFLPVVAETHSFYSNWYNRQGPIQSVDYDPMT